jgi:hypothetical protein
VGLFRWVEVIVNGTDGPRRWAEGNLFPTGYFRTAIAEREAHWPKGQGVAILFRQTPGVARCMRGSSAWILLRDWADSPLAEFFVERRRGEFVRQV